MKFKKGIKIYDKFVPEHVGIIKQVLKTRVKVQFNHDEFGDWQTYDLPHAKLCLRRYNAKTTS